MQKKDWRYKVGGGLGGLIPSLLLLVLFGGVSWWLFRRRHPGGGQSVPLPQRSSG